jgi:anti-sigma28 factor (negative regulator of flagellin synthesis)
MAFNPSSFFAGVGTVVLAMGLGFGGGLVLTGSDHKFDPPNRVERVASAPPLRSAPSAQASVPLGAPSASDPEPTTSSSQQGAATQPSPPPEPVRAEAQPTPAANEQHAATNDQPKQQRQQTQPQQAQQPSAQQSSALQPTAKPHDQDADAKKVAERKQAQRRRWADRRRQLQPDDADGAVAEVKRIDQPDEGREVVQQRDLFEMPRFGFFGQ